MEHRMLEYFDNINSHHEFILFTPNPTNRTFKKIKVVDLKKYVTMEYRFFSKIHKYDFIFKYIRILYKLLCRKKYDKLTNKYSYKLLIELASIDEKIDLFYSFVSFIDSISIPYIATCTDCNDIKHPYLPEFRKNVFQRIEFDEKLRNYYRYATYIIASTNAHKEQLSTYYGVDKDKVHIIPYYVDDLKDNYEYYKINDIDIDFLPKPYLFFAGKYLPQKNHIVTLLALKILKEQRGLSLNFVCTGGDAYNKSYLLQKVKELGLENQVTLLDIASNQQLKLLYKNAFALVFPVFNGPDNLPPIEAMYYGCPVIASHLEGSIEQLGDAALLFDPHNEYELAEKIFSLYSNPQLRQTLINKGFERVKNLTPQMYFGKVLEIINKFELKRRAWA
jgi:glycosyltransferase involved in cell wall biosynthesis